MTVLIHLIKNQTTKHIPFISSQTTQHLWPCNFDSPLKSLRGLLLNLWTTNIHNLFCQKSLPWALRIFPDSVLVINFMSTCPYVHVIVTYGNGVNSCNKGRWHTTFCVWKFRSNWEDTTSKDLWQKRYPS